VNSQFHFARALQSAIGNDSGSIFKFATHENSIVNAIISKESQEADKRTDLLFLKPLANPLPTKSKLGRRPQHDRFMQSGKRLLLQPIHQRLQFHQSGVAGKPEFKRILKKEILQPIGTIGLSSHNFPASHLVKMDGDSDKPI
jgi:hypothetical protein